jgi:hypothetical protein
MNTYQSIRVVLQKLQSYATQYFTALYNSSICFWTIPALPTGANILTGAFAYLMIYNARSVFSPPDINAMEKILFYGTLIMISVCGILVIFDPLFSRTRVAAWRKLVSTVWIGSILGCIFIVLDTVVPWINEVFAFAKYLGLISQANLLVASVAAFLAFVVLVANSIPKMRGLASLYGVRNLAWSGVILVLLILGVYLLVMNSYS